MATRVSPGDDSDLVHIPLLKEEDARYAANTGISSANFYEGDIKIVHDDLKARLKEVLRANPWIAGVVQPLSTAPKQTKKQIENNPVTKGKIGKSILVFPKVIADSDIDNVVESILTLEEKKDPRLQRSSNYGELARACQSDSRVVPNRAGLYRSGQKVTKITLVPISDDEFCVVFAMSHLIADGDTYFKIMTMLSTKKQGKGDGGGAAAEASSRDPENSLFNVDELDPNRQYNYREIEQAALGTTEWKFQSSLKLVKMMVQGLMTKPKKNSSTENCTGYEEPGGLRIRINLIDKTKVDAQKQIFQDGLDGNGTGVNVTEKIESVKFISTQDIITSSWLNASSSRLPMFAFNLRERCPKLSKNLAGNYETCMLLDPPSYTDASLIRISLLPNNDECFTRANPMPLPGFCGKSSSAFITTWCFSVDGKAAGLYLHDCQQLLHMPIMPVSILRMCPMDFAVVFNSNIDNSDNRGKNRQAIIMFCKEATDDMLMNSSDSVLGDVVSADSC